MAEMIDDPKIITFSYWVIYIFKVYHYILRKLSHSKFSIFTWENASKIESAQVL